jgi:hypothetical protein
VLEDEPEAWIGVKHRAFQSSTLYFGPFSSPEELNEWAKYQGVTGLMIVPVYKTVDWSR